MFATLSFGDCLIFLAGFIWVLKKLAEMDRYHSLRVFVLTTFLSCFAIYCFLAVGGAFDNPEPDYYEADHFTLSEI